MPQLSRRLELAFDISRIGVFEVDLDTGIVSWDERDAADVRQGRGTLSAARIGRTRSTRTTGSRRSPIVARAVADGAQYSHAFRIVRSDGEIRHIRARGAPFVDVNGVSRLIGANWDVTEDVLLQQELQRAKDLAEARSAALEEARARIEYTALHDHLTGLPNRRYLDSTLEERARSAAQNGTRLSILHIDLDRFKEINDTLGHTAGDGMLVACRRRSQPRRWGRRISSPASAATSSLFWSAGRISAISGTSPIGS